MPIYAYRCTSCGHAKDVLQKISDPLLTDCPECGAATFTKQVTAAGFQLKGSGWYVTDFRGGNSGGQAEGDGADKGSDKDATPVGDKGTDKGADKGADKAANAETAKAAQPAAGKTSADAKAAPAPAPAAPAPPPAGS
ncbi:MAG: zinc ribbon domain-containing protein [Rubrivivax sp.]|nr:zinc ribbon domain-containing protein [Rubrivivax sp.]